MRLLFVVQRYGAEVAGGAEQHCRQFATRMASRGHDVEVLTSCALKYTDWADHYPPGRESVDGVVVNRLGVRRSRDRRLGGPLDERVVTGRKPVPFHLQREWMRLQGPDLPGLRGWLEERAAGYDVVVFFTYLYETTFAGLPVAARLAPTVLHPTAHDEPPFRLELFDLVLRHPHAFACSTEEEAALVRSKVGSRPPIGEIGIGIELDRGGDGRAFRARYGLHDRPYLLYVGRVDSHKGSEELHDFFIAYKRRQPGDLALVVVGEQVGPLAPHPDVVLTGFVDEATRRGALTGALAAVVPSYFESFSMVLAEAWAERKAALVQGWCDVLDGQARRSGGAIPYRGFAEFEVAVDAIVADPGLAEVLGESGRRYVEARYRWDDVLDHYERHLRLVMRLHGATGRRTRFRADVEPKP
jgi:glycosyltransferase involved in cell wall biosynthesis